VRDAVARRGDEEERRNELGRVAAQNRRDQHPHQREGVAFMFECVTGIKGFDGRGCLLADDVSFIFVFFFEFSPEEEKTSSKNSKTFPYKKQKKQTLTTYGGKDFLPAPTPTIGY
jgi:hypothetical protein